MKVVQVSTSDMGGAGIAARRLHLALLRNGVSSVFLSLLKLSNGTQQHVLLSEKSPGLKDRLTSRLRYHLPSLFKAPENKLANSPAGYEYFSLPDSKVDLINNEHLKQAELVHLHWVSDGVLNYEEFFSSVNKPVVWTLHDMNPFTGGCHHSDGCLAFVTGCGVCFQIKGISDELLAEKSFRLKEKALRKIDPDSLVIVTPSAWLSELSRQSSLFKRFKHYVIPNIVDEQVFKLREKKSVRKELGIKESSRVILFVANDVTNTRKGIAELLESIKHLTTNDLLVCTVGNKLEESQVNFTLKQFGFISSDEMMSKIYAASDVFVLPSHAENFPNTIVESLLCGTPVVASEVGGIPEQITSNNGLLFPKGDVRALTKAIDQILNNHTGYDPEEIRREALVNYSSKSITDKYLAIYSDLLKSDKA